MKKKSLVMSIELNTKEKKIQKNRVQYGRPKFGLVFIVFGYGNEFMWFGLAMQKVHEY
jgi:hypothetical protein